MMHYYNLPAQIPALLLLFKPHSLFTTTCKQYTAHAHTINTIIKDHMRASELANTAQLNSRGSHGVALHTEDGNGSNSEVGRARCQ